MKWIAERLLENRLSYKMPTVGNGEPSGANDGRLVKEFWAKMKDSSPLEIDIDDRTPC